MLRREVLAKFRIVGIGMKVVMDAEENVFVPVGTALRASGTSRKGTPECSRQNSGQEPGESSIHHVETSRQFTRRNGFVEAFKQATVAKAIRNLATCKVRAMLGAGRPAGSPLLAGCKVVDL